MVNEVEDILNEIRERVRADHEQGSVPGALVVQDETVKDSLADPTAKSESESTESLGRLSAHLTTTARAWDRLPPMFSNRKGGAARLELWIKARLKSMSRWFTWEQVNFNSAVHHALSETLNALSAYEQSLARMRAELSKETEARREKFERRNRELTALRAGLEAQAAESRKRNANLEARSATIEARSAAIEARSATIEARAAEMAAGVATEMNAARGEIDAARVMMNAARVEMAAKVTTEINVARVEMAAKMTTEINAARVEMAAKMTTEINAARVEINEARTEMTSRLAELAGELRESDEQQRAEQRVCFKQLSLEASEGMVMEDRGRRVIESRLDKLEKTVSDGEG